MRPEDDHPPRDPESVSEGGRPTREAPRPAPSPILRCDLCGGPVLDRHCKVICLNCGYQRDCSDP